MKKGIQGKNTNIVLTILLLTIILLVFGYYSNKQRYDKLNINKCYATGHISKFESRFRGGAGYLYEFTVNGKTYSDSYSYPDNNAPFDNKTFTVVYECNNPDNHALLIFKKDFEKYDEIFPDSMSWLIPYDK